MFYSTGPGSESNGSVDLEVMDGTASSWVSSSTKSTCPQKSEFKTIFVFCVASILGNVIVELFF